MRILLLIFLRCGRWRVYIFQYGAIQYLSFYNFHIVYMSSVVLSGTSYHCALFSSGSFLIHSHCLNYLYFIISFGLDYLFLLPFHKYILLSDNSGASIHKWKCDKRNENLFFQIRNFWPKSLTLCPWFLPFFTTTFLIFLPRGITLSLSIWLFLIDGSDEACRKAVSRNWVVYITVIKLALLLPLGFLSLLAPKFV